MDYLVKWIICNMPIFPKFAAGGGFDSLANLGENILLVSLSTF